MNEASHTFRGHTFRVLRGSTHPEYSLTCFANEEADFRELFWDPRPGEVVVDVGASYGAYTLTAAACGARVIAFEPDDAVFADLKRNVLLNGFAWLVRLCGIGLWDEHAEVDMHSYAPHWPAGTVANRFKMTTLDSFALPQVDWLKVDVEGAEAHVLRGAQETIARCKPRVIVEVHTFLDPKLLDECEALLPGYKLERVPRDPCVMLVGAPA